MGLRRWTGRDNIKEGRRSGRAPCVPFRSSGSRHWSLQCPRSEGMKKAGAFMASIAAASSAALSPVSAERREQVSSSSSPSITGKVSTDSSRVKKAGSGSRRSAQPDREKFLPRFDGLRFIETLVTAHR